MQEPSAKQVSEQPTWINKSKLRRSNSHTKRNNEGFGKTFKAEKWLDKDGKGKFLVVEWRIQKIHIQYMITKFLETDSETTTDSKPNQLHHQNSPMSMQ